MIKELLSKKLILSLVVGLILIVLFLNKSSFIKPADSNSTNSLNNIVQKTINDKFGNSYQIKSETIISNLLVTVAIIKKSFNPPNDPKSNSSPIIFVQDLKTNQLLAEYEINFINQGKREGGDSIHLGAIQFEDDSSLRDAALISEWTISWGGSSGLKGLIVFRSSDNSIIPSFGYPDQSDNKIEALDKLTNKSYTFPIVGDSDFTQEMDLNGDRITDLLLGTWKWDLANGESHYQSRNWNLQVFELGSNGFQKAKWWNNGNTFITPDKIGYSDEDDAKLMNYFKNNRTQKTNTAF